MSEQSTIVLDDVEFYPSPDGGYVITWIKDGNKRRDTVSEVVGLMFKAIIKAIQKPLPDVIKGSQKVAKKVVRKRGKI